MIEIPLKGATRGTSAVIDDADLPIIERYRGWRLAHDGYAVTSVQRDRKRRQIQMHRLIMDAPPLTEVDHINGDRADNRRDNLRLCTRRQNSHNSKRHFDNLSRFKGVKRDRRRHIWTANITANGKTQYLGSFAHEIEAAMAYDRAAMDLHGEFARLNFPALRSASA